MSKQFFSRAFHEKGEEWMNEEKLYYYLMSCEDENWQNERLSLCLIKWLEKKFSLLELVLHFSSFAKQRPDFLISYLRTYFAHLRFLSRSIKRWRRKENSFFFSRTEKMRKCIIVLWLSYLTSSSSHTYTVPEWAGSRKKIRNHHPASSSIHSLFACW